MKAAFSVLLLFGLVGPLRSQPQPPPEVDQALRSRVTLFYQAHVDGKPRRADEVVAEDSKDIFFEQGKPRSLGFSIRGVSYSDNFTRAEVTVDCEEDFVIAGLGNAIRIKIARLTRWKLVDGLWFWYVDPKAVYETPFGPMKPGGFAPDGSKATLQIPSGPSPEDMRNAVKTGKTEVTLSASQPSTETVTVTNGMPGWVTLKLLTPPVAGLEAVLDRTALQMNQEATLTLRYRPPAKGEAPQEPVTVTVMVDPMGAMLPVKITFTPGPPRAAAPR